MHKKEDIREIFKGKTLPNHVALICDGNRRWAKSNGLTTIEGHKKGAEAIKEITNTCLDIGIKTFTVWVFSTENWSRGKKEAGAILRLIERALDENIKEIKKRKGRIIHLGRKDRIPSGLSNKLIKVESDTLGNKAFVFNIALDYGGHDEIIRATRKIINSGLKSSEITEEIFEKYLDTGDQPYPNVDLLIRTSGEERISGFLPWQMNYAEIWWERSFLPDFSESKFVDVLLDYSRRHRRFGGTESSVTNFNFKPDVIASLECDWIRAKGKIDKKEYAAVFSEFVTEQFGISKNLAQQAAEMFVKAVSFGVEMGQWEKAKKLFIKFYEFLKRCVDFAFNPVLVADLEIQYLKKFWDEKASRIELQNIISSLYAELFRIPVFQSNDIAHYRLLARDQELMAENEKNFSAKKKYYKNAHDYLTLSYKALQGRLV